MRATPVVVSPPPLCKSQAQCDGVNGVLHHLLQVSDKIPITPFPSMVVAYAFVSFFFSFCVVCCCCCCCFVIIRIEFEFKPVEKNEIKESKKGLHEF